MVETANAVTWHRENTECDMTILYTFFRITESQDLQPLGILR